MVKELEERIMREMKYNMNAHEFGEDTIFFASIIITRKDKRLIPTYTVITDEKSESDRTRLNRAMREYSAAIVELIEGGVDKAKVKK